MARKFYSRRHFERLSNGPPDTAKTIEDRRKLNAICEQVGQEVRERWPEITVENAREVTQYQQDRIRELRMQAGIWM